MRREKSWRIAKVAPVELSGEIAEEINRLKFGSLEEGEYASPGRRQIHAYRISNRKSPTAI
jgi:hypothetical protein